MIVSTFKNMFHCFRKTDRRRPLQRAVGYVFVTRYVLIANESLWKTTRSAEKRYTKMLEWAISSAI